MKFGSIDSEASAEAFIFYSFPFHLMLTFALSAVKFLHYHE